MIEFISSLIKAAADWLRVPEKALVPVPVKVKNDRRR